MWKTKITNTAFIIMSKRSASSLQSQQQSKKKTQKSLGSFFTSAKNVLEEEDKTTTGYKIFCDLDGVLVDFEAGVKKIFNGQGPDDLHVGRMWSGINKVDNFYGNLPWTTDGKELWNTLKQHSNTPDILTGVPLTKSSRAEKFNWCKRELVLEEEETLTVNHVDMAGSRSKHECVSGRRKNKDGVVNVFTCWSKNKHYESKENHVLIDDRISLKEEWEQRGGIFIHHTSTERSLAMLREKGILVDDVEDAKKKNSSTAGKTEES